MSCKSYNCEYWDDNKKICSDERVFINQSGDRVCGKRDDAVFIDGETSKESKVIASLIMVCKLTVDSQGWDGNNDDRWAGFYKKAKKTLKEAKEFFNLK
jgi:hypothetical protein